jgi:hypothetical protein
VTLPEARDSVGMGVVYTPSTMHGPPRTARPEDGVITSVNETWVFVRYAGDQHSKATAPQDLELLAGAA